MRRTEGKITTRRDFLSQAGLGLGAASWSLGSFAEKTANPPNILYVFSDEHRWQSMSFSEMPEVKTPAMAAMAQQGFCFRQCVSNYPVCSPHRAVLLTGLWPYQNGMIDNDIELSASLPTVAQAFRVAGYETGYIGKWHLGSKHVEKFGFDTSLVWTDESQHWDEGKYHPKEGPPVQPKGYNATLMTDQALEFVGRPRSKPFFLMLALHPPHANFLDAPPEKKALYPENSLPRRPNFRSGKNDGQKGNAFATSDEVYRGYHAHISAIDDELRRIMDMLKAKGLAENTILIYSSDHGSMQGSHGLGGKRQVYEESVRVPFLVHAPGRVQPGVSDALFSTIDIMPTLCGLAGVPVPKTCKGMDCSPLIHGATGFTGPDSQFLMHIQKSNASGGEKHPAPLFRGVRTARFTYACGPEGYHCLFDRQADPYQMKNLATVPECAEERKKLRARLADWLKQAEDPFVLPDTSV